MKKEALKLNAAGFKVIPTNDPNLPDGKRPMCKSWKQYQEKQTPEEVDQLFSQKNIGGMALLTADGIEVIDVDLKYALDDNLYPNLLDKIIDTIGLETYEKLIQSQTISGGYHIMYRTNIPGGNQKLAQRYTLDSEKKNEHDKIRVLLETRGVGGYILIPPTPGYEYENKYTHTILNIPKITDEERNGIINACKLFNETTEHYKNVAPIPVAIAGKYKSVYDAYNDAHSPKDLIESHGWQFKYQSGENLFYVRPGKTLKQGHGGSYHTGLNVFYCYTSSTQFEQEKGYNAFQVFTILEHGGDAIKARNALYKDGYGDRLSKNRDTFYDNVITLTEEVASNGEKLSVWDKIYPKRFSINNVPPKMEYVLFVNNDPLESPIPIASFGDLLMVTGAAKSRKSALSNSIAAALLSSNKEVLRFQGDIKGRNIVLLDTEQNQNDFYKSVKQIYHQAGITDGSDPKNFYAFPMCEESIIERLEFVKNIFEKLKDVGVLVLDGIVDVCEDYNDQKGSRVLVKYLTDLTRKYNTLFIPILHTARSTGSARGHLGNELLNKCKATITVTKNKETKDSLVEFPMLRGSREPDAYKFTHDSNGNLITL